MGRNISVFYMNSSHFCTHRCPPGIFKRGFVPPSSEDDMSQPFIDFAHIKEHASFERILEHYQLPVTGRGVQRSVLCPFHREQRPSCKVELKRGIFHCFGCGEKGNVL